MIDSLSERLTELIIKNSGDISEEKSEIIKYGLNVLMSEVLLLAVVFLSGAITGQFRYVLAVFLSYGLLRSFAGGAHAGTRLQCAVTYIAALYANIAISRLLWAENYYPAIAVFIIELAIVLKYAPGDTKEKPILSKRIKKRLKILSSASLVAIFSGAVILWHYDRVMYNAVIIATLPVMLFLSPLGYKVFNSKHSFDA